MLVYFALRYIFALYFKKHFFYVLTVQRHGALQEDSEFGVLGDSRVYSTSQWLTSALLPALACQRGADATFEDIWQHVYVCVSLCKAVPALYVFYAPGACWRICQIQRHHAFTLYRTYREIWHKLTMINNIISKET